MGRTGGRVRSADAHEAVLAAASEMLEECGYQTITIEGIAQRAGVAKSTIYRWWKGKPELVMEAFTSVVARGMPEPDTGSLTTDLTIFVQRLYEAAGEAPRARALRGLMGEAQLNPDFVEAYQAWVQTRRDVVLGILRRARERDELRHDADLDLTVDQLFGTFWYRLLVGHLALDPGAAAAHATQLVRGIGNTPHL